MIVLLDPTVQRPPQAVTYVPRPFSLEGTRVALIDNTKHNSDRLLQGIGDILRTDYGVTETRMWRKRNANVPADDGIIRELRETCDVMIAGIGD